MLTPKKKITRKEIKQDNLVTFYYKAYAFLDEHKRNLAIVVGGIALVILAVVLYKNNQAADNEIAGADLYNTVKLFEANQFQDAIEGKPGTNVVGLRKIVEDYGSTENGELAKIYLGNAYLMLAKFDEALKAYEDYGGGNDLLKAAALAGEAACYEAKEDYENAASYYLKASKVTAENVLNPQYILFAGINYLNIGKQEEAKELFETIKRDFSKSMFARDVDRYLAQVQ